MPSISDEHVVAGFAVPDARSATLTPDGWRIASPFASVVHTGAYSAPGTA